ncbi:MAG: ATP synthase F1 subunit delta [Clostridia bacterium]|nr:ATP synthase F1 subunit delta [Clostridia bacterium]
MMQTDKEYAEALFMLAAEEQKIEQYTEYLNTISALIRENPDYTDFLSSPAIPLEERLKAIDDAFDETMPEYIVSFLKLLCENGHIRSLNECISEFKKLVMVISNKAVANVYSAIELTDEQKNALCEKLSKITGKVIQPVYTVDESLIGGVKIEIEGKTYDGSIKHRLYDVKDVII